MSTDTQKPEPPKVRKLSKEQRRIIAVMKRALAYAGSQGNLARMCDYTQQGISLVLKTGRCSPHLAVRIHEATRGRVDAGDLCPVLRALPPKNG